MRHACLGEGLRDAAKEGRSHVAGEGLHLGGVRAFGLQERFELEKGRTASPLAGIQNAPGIQVHEDRDVVVAAQSLEFSRATPCLSPNPAGISSAEVYS